ncbi:hypothetical protein IP88_15220 [alpha proteobacterium AAP81b]|nr:hypothetical protein IP88_15220 [alpha proteobacterium AAP81b]
MSVAIDTNILAYAAGVARARGDAAKVVAARELLRRLATRAQVVVPVQALAELFVVLTRSGDTREAARDTVLRLHAAYIAAESASGTLLSALDAAVAHQLQLWDALILTAAAEAGCILLLSEDMAPGFTWRGVTLVNPLATPADARLSTILQV